MSQVQKVQSMDALNSHLSNYQIIISIIFILEIEVLSLFFYALPGNLGRTSPEIATWN